MRSWVQPWSSLTILLLLAPTVSAVHAQTCDPGAVIIRASVAPDGTQGNLQSFVGNNQVFSSDGRYLVFNTTASNLITPDTNSTNDILVYDRQTCQLVRVTVNSDGVEANNASAGEAISGDGRYVVFESSASNLVSGDSNVCDEGGADPGRCPDVFIHDRDSDSDGIFDESGATSKALASVASDGTQGNNSSTQPFISSNGRFVAFTSQADNLVSGDTNSVRDVFVRDLQLSQTVRVSVASDGTEANGESYLPVLSADGRFVAFFAYSTNLVANDTNNRLDAFLHDRDSDNNGVFDEAGAVETRRVSVSSSGEQGNGNSTVSIISANGRYISFYSEASNLVADDTNNFGDGFIYDRLTGQTTRVTVASNSAEADRGILSNSAIPLSGDGHVAAFSSSSTNLVSGDTNVCPLYDGLTDIGTCPDIFVRDLLNGQTFRVSVAADGAQGNSESVGRAVAANGRYIAFHSRADNLVSGDTNTYDDVFIVRITLPSPPGVAPDRNYYDTSTATLTWNQISWATGYEVQVATDSQFNYVVFPYTAPDGDTLAVTVDSLTDGVYFWRVRAKKPDGTWSAWSTVDSFIVDAP